MQPTPAASPQSNNTLRRILTIVIAVGGSLFFLWLAFSRIEVDDVLDNLSHTNPVWIGVGFLCTSLSIVARSMRWRILLDSQLTARQAFPIVSVGVVTNLLPMRAGDILRASLLRRHNIPFITGLSSLIIENLQDILTVVVLLVIAFSRVTTIADEAIFVSQLFGGLSVVVVILLIWMIRYPDHGRSLIDRITALMPILERFNGKQRFEEILRGVQPLSNPQTFFQSILWTGILWFFNLAGFYAIGLAFHFQGVDLLLWTILSVSLISLSIAIPVSFAGIGAYQMAVIIAGGMIGVDMVDSLVLGITVHGVTILTFLLWGIISMGLMGMSWGRIVHLVGEVQTQPNP